MAITGSRHAAALADDHVSPDGDGSAGAGILATLDKAHGEIERRFLDGGSVLVSTVEILNELVAHLDTITGSMDQTTTQQTVDNLLKPVHTLSELPSRQDNRLQKFRALSDLGTITADKIAAMHLIIRYMQTFAVTAKITSASITDFATFAEEIRERVRSGAAEVTNLDELVRQMRLQLQTALSFSSEIGTEYAATIPDIVANLSAKSDKVSAQYDRMLALAGQVRTVVQSFQARIGTVLSGLQLGDITRQRIEHIRDMLVQCDGFIAGPFAARHGVEAGARLKNQVARLAQAQLQATIQDFNRGCQAIVRNIASFRSDVDRIQDLRDQLAGATKLDGVSLLATMKTDIRNACDLVQRVQAKSAEANQIVGSVTRSSRDLVRGVGLIRGIQSDIHYMSLNTNLRSSKLGDSGKSVKVVSDELRKYSEQLDEAAEGIVTEFEKLSSIADELGHETGFEINDLESPLLQAMETLSRLDEQIGSSLAIFSESSLSAHQRIEREVSRLDFGRNLGDTLDTCLGQVSAMAARQPGLDNTLHPDAADLNRQIFASYTMLQEREIHQAIFPVGPVPARAEPAAAAQPPADDDEALFADALF